MHPTRRLVGPLLLSALCLLAAATGARAASSAPANRVLVKVTQMTKLGKVLVTATGMTLYYLTTETHGTIRCTGACATVWHPLLAPRGRAVAATLAGVTGRFGMIIRPGGARQVTWKSRPL